MDTTIDLNGTWKDCERHIDQLTQLVRQVHFGSSARPLAAKVLGAHCTNDCLRVGATEGLSVRELN